MYYVSHVHLNELIVSYLSLSLLDFALLVCCKSWRMLKNISSFIKWTINLLYCHFACIDSLHFLFLLPRTFLGFAVESTILSVALNLPETVLKKVTFSFPDFCLYRFCCLWLKERMKNQSTCIHITSNWHSSFFPLQSVLLSCQSSTYWKILKSTVMALQVLSLDT